MTWVAWRLQRTELLITLGIVALLAALLIPTGIHMANAYHDAGLGSCVGAFKGSACDQQIGDFQARFEGLSHLTDLFTILPGLIGVLLAAPFIFDLEHGTYRLAWTQSVTRRRWLVGKLAIPIAGAVLAAGVLILLLTWWHVPQVHLNGRLDTGTYDAEGTVAIGYTLFALGLALAVGAVWRRAVASISVAVVAYFAMRIFVDTWLRDRLVSPLKITWQGAQPHVLSTAKIVSENVLGGRGPIKVESGGPISGHAQLAVPGGPRGGPRIETVYHPASHFWPLQLAETGLFLGLAALLIVFAAWWTHERTV
jgi:hypothetical protein